VHWREMTAGGVMCGVIGGTLGVAAHSLLWGAVAALVLLVVFVWGG
jgi:hypothetical protein